MGFFNNMKVGMKLAVLIFIALLSLGAVGAIGYYYLHNASQDMNTMYAERLIPISLIIESRTYARTANGAVVELMLTTDAKRSQELKKIIDDRTTKVGNNLAVIEKLPLDPQAAELLLKVKQSQEKYRIARNEVINLALQNKNVEAYAQYCSNVDPLTTKYTDDLRNLDEHYSKLAEEMNKTNQAATVKAAQTILGITLIIGILLIAIGLFITRTITIALQLMVSACKELADGDFRDKPRKVLRKDEIGQLAEALANMRTSLRTVFKQVNESSEQVAASSEELTASAEQSAQAVDQVAESICDVAQSAERQLKAVTETSAVIEQMSAGIQQAAASANQVAGKSTQAVARAIAGNESVEKAVGQMTYIEQSVNNSAQVVAKLGERSKEIGQIIDSISGIASQTNLLALNAAIEAARAGEQGKGFAVVAEEVRRLAEQSQDAAKQIAAMIGEIQGDTDKAVVAMNEGTREVIVGTEVVTAAGQAFQEIKGLVTQVSEQVSEISSAMQQMAGGSHQIAASVKEIDNHSKMTAGQAQTVSAATEEQAASMEEISSASQSLAKLAQELQLAVSHFKV